MISTAALALFALTQSTTPEALWVRVVSPLVKVRPGSPFDGATAARVSLGRNECEGVQLRVREGSAGVALSVEAPAKDGTTLSATALLERFIRVSTPSNHEGAAGLWPDPLVPLRGTALASTPDAPLVLYLELCADATVPPGEYAGAVVFHATDLREQRVPVSVSVQRFTLPATSSLPNTFGLSLYSVAKGHGLPPDGDEARALLRKYAESALRHRMSLHGMSVDPLPVTFAADGAATVDFSSYDRELGPFFSGTALPSGARFTTAEVRDWPKRSAAQRTAYYKAWRAHFDERRWPQTLFFYAKDEPRPEDAALVRDQSERVRAAGRIPVLVTSPVDEGLSGAADILTPVLNCFFPRPGAKSCKRARSADEQRALLGQGKKLFWYQSCMSHGCSGGPLPEAELEAAFTGWASYAVDADPALNRAMGVLAFQSGVDGELYYSTVYAYEEQDPWASVWAFGGNGDGTLFYPGTPSRLGGNSHAPVESLRLKHLRDGLEDYEYLRALERAGKGALAHTLARGVARSGYDISRDPSVWEAFRARMTREYQRLP